MPVKKKTPASKSSKTASKPSKPAAKSLAKSSKLSKKAPVTPTVASGDSKAIAPADPTGLAVAEVFPPAQELFAKVESFIIRDSKDLSAANDALVQLKRIDLLVETKRKSLTKPLKDAAKKIEAQFKPTADLIEKSDAMLRSKLLAYRQDEERKAEEARKALLAQAATATEAGDTNAALVLSQQAMSVGTELATTSQATDGSVQVKMLWTFEVEDAAAVPLEYHTLDTTKIRAAVRAGVREIPGVRIFQHEQVAVSAA